MTDADRLRPYALDVGAACAQTQDDPYRLGALMLRETEAGQGPGYSPKGSVVGWGDSGHAFGLFQIDKRFHPEFIASAAAKTVFGQAQYALSLIDMDRRLVRVVCKVPDLLERSAYAAYNCGIRNVVRAINMGKSPDSYTTGGDYSAWIWKRADALRQSAPSLFGVAC